MDVKKILNTVSLVCGIIGGSAKVATLTMDFVAQASEWKTSKIEDDFDDDLNEDVPEN